MITVVLVLACGGAAALARFAVDSWVQSRRGDEFPLGTLVVNVSGSFLLGLLAGLHGTKHEMTLLGTATLGSYTTFSTWMLETGATVLRAVRGFYGGRQPFADRMISVRRNVPVLVVVIDTPSAVRELWPLIEELTPRGALVTSEMSRLRTPSNAMDGRARGLRLPRPIRRDRRRPSRTLPARAGSCRMPRRACPTP